MSKAEDILDKFKRSLNTPSTKDEKIKVVLVCIVISTTFWFFNALNKNDYVTRINYPISIELDEEKYVATEPLPTRIPIEVSGGGWDLMARYFGLKMNTLDVSPESPDQLGYVLASSLRSEISEDLEPISINYFLTDSLRFKVEKKVSSEFILAYDTSAVSLSGDFIMASDIRIKPLKIELTGPSSVIEAMGDTLWLNEEIDGVSEDFSKEIGLPELPEFVSTGQKAVQVNFLVERLFSVDVSLPIEMRNFPKGNWQLDSPVGQVSYKVPETRLDVSDTTGIRLFVDYKRMGSDSLLTVQMEVLNELFREVRVSPENVKPSRNE